MWPVWPSQLSNSRGLCSLSDSQVCHIISIGYHPVHLPDEQIISFSGLLSYIISIGYHPIHLPDEQIISFSGLLSYIISIGYHPIHLPDSQVYYLILSLLVIILYISLTLRFIILYYLYWLSSYTSPWLSGLLSYIISIGYHPIHLPDSQVYYLILSLLVIILYISLTLRFIISYYLYSWLSSCTSPWLSGLLSHIISIGYHPIHLPDSQVYYLILSLLVIILYISLTLRFIILYYLYWLSSCTSPWLSGLLSYNIISIGYHPVHLPDSQVYYLILSLLVIILYISLTLRFIISYYLYWLSSCTSPWLSGLLSYIISIGYHPVHLPDSQVYYLILSLLVIILHISLTLRFIILYYLYWLSSYTSPWLSGLLSYIISIGYHPIHLPDSQVYYLILSLLVIILYISLTLRFIILYYLYWLSSCTSPFSLTLRFVISYYLYWLSSCTSPWLSGLLSYIISIGYHPIHLPDSQVYYLILSLLVIILYISLTLRFIILYYLYWLSSCTSPWLSGLLSHIISIGYHPVHLPDEQIISSKTQTLSHLF